MMILDPAEISFPDPKHYHPESGIIAVGGDLSPERLYFAYQLGLFPWYNPGEEILWWCPDPRFVLFPQKIKISKSMKKVLRDGIFTFTENTCFRKVMEACRDAKRKDQPDTWISSPLIEVFVSLHEIGLANSLEVWQNNILVGGFYGVHVGKIFCGESMFSAVSNASKAGFIHFVEKYQDAFNLIDCQIHSDHLESLGAEMIPKKEYLSMLKITNEPG